MPAIDFPSAPAVNDEYSFEGRTWLWNGTGWEVKPFPAALQLGTAANPSLYFTGDTNTGIYSPGADQVAISTNGTGRLFVDANGDVGLGESNPQTVLHVVSAAAADAIRWTDNTNSTAFLGTTTAASTIYTNTSLVFGTGSAVLSEKARITSDGRLGLGTSSPEVTFQVGNVSSGSSATNKGSIQINDAPTGFTSNGGLEFKSSDFGSGFGWRLISYNSSGNHFALGNRANSATWTQRITVLDSGNVGIGTPSPGSLLNLAHPTASDIRLTVAGTLIGNIYGSASDLNVYAVANVPLTFATNNAERARIDSSGRLLVGTSSIKTANSGLLEVNGANMGLASFQNNAFAYSYVFTKSRGTTLGTIVSSGDEIGTIQFRGDDGSGGNGVAAAFIQAFVDGTPGANDMPGRLVFSTTADGASSPTERLRITSAGVLQIADASNITVGTTTGTKIGTATTQKLGFYNATPVVQPVAVADATDAASAITQLNALLAHMRTLGLIAT